MSVIAPDSKVCTLINVFTVEPEKQQQLLDTLVEATDRVIRHLPGFISANFHKSIDGVRVTNYAQWEDEAALQAMLRNPEAMEHIKICQQVAKSIDFHIYTVDSCFVAAQTS
ncbi:MAG TPA: antibiotic biosynthesis monooxygenase family protein [Ktedonobacteraceae bacterium]|jgi:quinol monooxygenase YgiN